jgi:2-amino-4-hydroxy-6-hydroxymethyldihydropteridine diphosphokinase
VALGANLGNAAQTLHQALLTLAQTPGVHVSKASRLYRTAPVDSLGPDYLNAVVEVVTQLTAPALLAALQGVEQRFGRERPYPNAPRTLDLDLLLYGTGCIGSPALTVPHPRMWARAFVLVPLADVAPGLVSAEALQAVADQGISLFPHPVPLFPSTGDFDV